MIRLSEKSICSLLILLSLFLFPPEGKASSILDEVNIVSIRDMQLRKEKDGYLMDVICVIRNSNKHKLKFNDVNFKLAFAVNDAEEIKIGPTFNKEVLLEKKADSSHTDSDVRFVAAIGNDIQKFHSDITSSEEMSALLMDPAPKLNLHIQGDFGLGIEVKQGWVYLKSVTIDWILKVDVPRDVFVRTYKAIESAAGKGGSLSDDEVDKWFEEYDKDDAHPNDIPLK
ncbi:MAG: hypothetical protein BWK80_06655 [Desulfobacteraceae bacterium IS3]|nr:MAG: hypothetical protein BWK80_06655 [Desulfobacteraceae bacterium IS3]